jgi:hypothetical protein
MLKAKALMTSNIGHEKHTRTLSLSLSRSSSDYSTMASLGQYCTRNWLSSKNSFNTISISQSCNARQFRNVEANHHSSTRPAFCQLSSPGGKKQLLIRTFQKSKEDHQWRVGCGDDGSCGIAPFSPHIPSALDLIKDFYNAINSKDPEKLDETLDQLLSDACEYQDLFFYIPFQGKQVFIYLFNIFKSQFF